MTSAVPPEEEYSLLQDKIVERLVEVDFYIKCIGYNYRLLANHWGCNVFLSQRRLREAHDFWQEDVGRTIRESMPNGTKQLDHFKNASFIAFWLRRMLPLNETQKYPYSPTGKSFDAADVQRFFQYGNEICALVIGFQICLYYESSKFTVKNNNSVPMHPDRLAFLRSMTFPQSLLGDFAMVLKHKNMSPHGLYLMYKSLFATVVGGG